MSLRQHQSLASVSLPGTASQTLSRQPAGAFGSGIALLVFACGLLSGCAFPRRSTSLSTVRQAPESGVPNGLWRLRLVRAEIPPVDRSGRPWDEDGSMADPVLRLYRGDELVFETDALEDEREPRWDITTENLLFPSTQEVRVELWDDEALPTPIGVYRGRGVPTGALPGATTTLRLDGGATVDIVLEVPEAHRGTGVSLFEVRSDSLVLVEVLRHSPAGRAGLREGDAIIAIDGESVATLGGAAAASRLSMANSRRSTLRVRHGNGREEEVSIDGGFTWLSR